MSDSVFNNNFSAKNFDANIDRSSFTSIRFANVDVNVDAKDNSIISFLPDSYDLESGLQIVLAGPGAEKNEIIILFSKFPVFLAVSVLIIKQKE